MRTVEEIEKARRRARVSKRELCQASGIHAETYRRWLMERASPTMRRLKAVDQALRQLTIGAAE